MSEPLTDLRGLDISSHVLDNGLRVVLHQDTALPLVSLNVTYHVGSKNEQPSRTGLAHLFEHMLFQGSQHVGTNDHFRYVQQVGGVANGTTWYDRTNYFETLPSVYLDLALWLESDRMGYLLPAMTQEKLDNQRDVVINERRERVDNQPYGRAFERLHELLYPPQHPYHWPVIGYVPDIEQASLEDIESFFRTFYAPNNAVLALVGDFDPKHALSRIDAFFGDLPAGPDRPHVHTVPISHAGERSETMADRVALSRLYLAYEVPPYGSPDWYAADLLAAVLTAGKSSPLYRDLVYERQLAQDVSAFVFPTELGATFAVVATTRQGTTLEELEEAIADHLTSIRREPPSIIDTARAQERVTTSFFEEVQSYEERADLFALYTAFFNDPERLLAEPGRYAALAPEDLLRVAAEYLQPEGGARVRVLPQDS